MDHGRNVMKIEREHEKIQFGCGMLDWLLAMCCGHAMFRATVSSVLSLTSPQNSSRGAPAVSSSGLARSPGPRLLSSQAGLQ